MEKILKGLLFGVLIGLCVGFVGSIIVGCEVTAGCVEEWIGAFFGCGSCSKGCSGYWGDKGVQMSYLYSSLIASVIGGIYGIIKAIQDGVLDKEIQAKKEKEHIEKQRQKWISEVKQKALDVHNTSTRNNSSNKPLVSSTCKASDQMAAIVTELVKATELQGKIDAIAEELSREGGTAE